MEADSLRFASATELACLLRERQISSIELVRSHLDRIRTLNPVLNGMAALAAEDALERASELDRAMAEGQVRGPLHGIPFTVKDVYQVGSSIRMELPRGASPDTLLRT